MLISSAPMLASAKCVKGIAGIGYTAKAYWLDKTKMNNWKKQNPKKELSDELLDSMAAKHAIIRLGRRVCGPDNHLIAIRTQGRGIAKTATVVLGTMAITATAAAGCVATGATTCGAASTAGELAFGAFMMLPGKSKGNFFYLKDPKKTNVCLTGSVFHPKAHERNGKKKRHCKKGT